MSNEDISLKSYQEELDVLAGKVIKMCFLVQKAIAFEPKKSCLSFERGEKPRNLVFLKSTAR